jgi:hypothetical protein
VNGGKLSEADGARLGVPPGERDRWLPADAAKWVGVRVGEEDLWLRQGGWDSPSKDQASFDPLEESEPVASWLFLLLGLAVLVMGVGEFVAATVDRRVTGLMLLAVGGLGLGASAALAFPSGIPLYRRSLVVIAGCSLAGAGIYLGVVSLVFSPARAVVWAAWVGAACAATRLFDGRPHGAAAEGKRGTVGSVGSMLVAAGVSLSLVWSVLEFAWTQWASEHVGPTLQVTAFLERGAASDVEGFFAYVGRVDIENPTDRRVSVVGASVRVAAISFVQAPDDGAAVAGRAIAPKGPDLLRVRGQLAEGPARLVYWDPTVEPGWYFEPGEKWRDQFAVLVPRQYAEGHPILRMTVDLYAADASRVLKADAKETLGDAGLPKAPQARLRRGDIPAPGLVHLLTRGQQQLLAIVFPPIDGALDIQPTVKVCITDRAAAATTCDPEKTAGRVIRWDRYYGLVGTSAQVETPLPRG